MSWDSVPWFVGGGAQHSPEIARLLAYASTGSAEGIVSPGDLKVAPTAVPGSSVRVLAGAALILNKAAGGSQQTYVARNPSEDVVSIAATGSGAGRSDLIVARIEDSNMAGEPWATPSDRTKGPYIFTRVISNVAAGTTKMPAGQSGIPLARIDIPSSTGTITAGMIVDLRSLARPRSSNELTSTGLQGIGGTLTSTSYVRWPNWSPRFVCPEWATHVNVISFLTGIQAYNQITQGDLVGNIGVVGSSPFQVSGQHGFDFDPSGATSQGGTREQFTVTCGGTVPTAARGQTVEFYILGRRYASAPGNLDANLIHSAMAVDIRFYERAV